MSIELPDYERKREDALDRLYELREQFKIIANSDAEYAKYAENALQRLQEEGYDIDE
jgi:hypothetical protein